MSSVLFLSFYIDVFHFCALYKLHNNFTFYVPYICELLHIVFVPYMCYYNINKKTTNQINQEEMDMTKLYIQAITEMGCCVYTEINLPEDYTMNMVVEEVKRCGYKQFRIVDTMKRFVSV